MSLGKVKTNIVSGVKDLKTPEGMKRTLVHLGIGAVVGIILDLVLEAIWAVGGVQAILDKTGYPRLRGFTVFPQDYDAQGAFLNWDDVILLIITFALLLSKKFFFVIGFFIGWWSSSYMGLYGALGLPRSLDFLTKPAT